MTRPQLAVIVPAFNEAQRLTENLLTLLSYLQSYRPEAELIVVDDGSTDGTAQVAEELFARRPDVMARVLRFAVNRGKGHAVRAGLLAAQAPIAVFSDADLSTPFTELPKIVEPIEAGHYDIVLGSRALDRSLIGHRQPWRREQGGKVFNAIVRLTTGLPFSDTQCGFKAFRTETTRPIIEQALDRWLRLRRRIAFPRAARRIAHARGAGPLGSQRGKQGAYRARQLAHVCRSRELADAGRAGKTAGRN